MLAFRGAGEQGVEDVIGRGRRCGGRCRPRSTAAVSLLALHHRRNCLTDHLRRKKAEAIPEEGNLADHRHWTADEELAEAELRDTLARCLEKLERLDAQLADLVRSRVGGESYDDFCARSGMPADKAYRAFHHAKAQLQRCVEGKVNP